MQNTVCLCHIMSHSTQAAVSAETASQPPLRWIAVIVKHCCKIVNQDINHSVSVLGHTQVLLIINSDTSFMVAS